MWLAMEIEEFISAAILLAVCVLLIVFGSFMPSG